MFSALNAYTDDPIEALLARLAGDPNPEKLDLGIGTYRDERGNVAVFDSVRAAERRLLERGAHKGYRGPAGNALYTQFVERLVLGRLTETRTVSSIQTPGAGGACHVGARLIKELAPNSVVWVSAPSWQHQIRFFEKVGLRIREYPYYDAVRSAPLFDDMFRALQGLKAQDVVLLHGSCHNPTGEDPTPQIWQQLGRLCAEKGAVPFVDVAYQGYGDGIAEDVAGLSAIASEVPETIVAVSSSKSFAVYCDRAGMLSLVSNGTRAAAANARRLLRDLARDSYFMPPEHGAAIVAEILGDDDLRSSWESEIGAVRERVRSLRHLFSEALLAAGLRGDYVVRQKGMFSCLPLTPAEQAEMERQHGIYMLPNARMNFAALSERSVDRVVSALCSRRIARRA